MSCSKYKVLALDIDGTLARNDRTISEYTQKTLVEAQKLGIRVVIASGRPLPGIRPIADLLQLKEYGGFVLAYNGGEIWDWQSGEQIYTKPLPSEVLPVIYNSCKDAGIDLMTYCGDNIVTEAKDNKYIQLSSMRNRMPVRIVSSFLCDIQYPVFKCMIVDEPDTLQRFEKKLNAAIQGRAIAFRSEPFYLEVVPEGIDKAACLKIILSRLSLTTDALIACGDGYNDISMIRYAGLGVAMANANEELKQSADLITLSNEDDGVADLVRKVILQK